VSSHQSGQDGEELAAGNAGCPGLRGRCLPSGPADDYWRLVGLPCCRVGRGGTL